MLTARQHSVLGRVGIVTYRTYVVHGGFHGGFGYALGSFFGGRALLGRVQREFRPVSLVRNG